MTKKTRVTLILISLTVVVYLLYDEYKKNQAIELAQKSAAAVK